MGSKVSISAPFDQKGLGNAHVSISAVSPKLSEVLKRCGKEETELLIGGASLISVLPSGQYAVRTEAANFLPTLTTFQTRDGEPVDVSIVLSRGRALDFTVTDDRGIGLGETLVAISWFSAGGRLTSTFTTATSGQTTVRAPSEAVLQVGLSLPAHAEVSISTNAGEFPHRIALTRLGSLRADFIDARTRRRVPNARVKIQRSEIDPPDRNIKGETATTSIAARVEGLSAWSLRYRRACKRILQEDHERGKNQSRQRDRS